VSDLPPISDAGDGAYYSGALVRIARNMLAIALLLSLAAWWKFGWRTALGFASGCAIAWLNFHWLKRVVTALADRATQSGVKQSSAGVVMRFLMRYFLMALGAYVMIKRWPESLNGLLAGLFLPVAGVMWEAAHELVFSATRER
jgi:small-conductance mechanosensitive channel